MTRIKKGRKYLIPLEQWCQSRGLSAANARGYYLPAGRIPGAIKIGGAWWVPETSLLLPKKPIHAPERSAA